MADFNVVTFTNAKQELDGVNFENCTFRNCVLTYAGGVRRSKTDASFLEIGFEFTEAAGNTGGFLLAMAAPNSGLQSVILDTSQMLTTKN